MTKLLKLICIKNNINNKAIKVKIENKNQSMQEPEGLKYLIKKLKFDK